MVLSSDVAPPLRLLPSLVLQARQNARQDKADALAVSQGAGREIVPDLVVLGRHHETCHFHYCLPEHGPPNELKSDYSGSGIG